MPDELLPPAPLAPSARWYVGLLDVDRFEPDDPAYERIPVPPVADTVTYANDRLVEAELTLTFAPAKHAWGRIPYWAVFDRQSPPDTPVAAYFLVAALDVFAGQTFALTIRFQQGADGKPVGFDRPVRLPPPSPPLLDG